MASAKGNVQKGRHVLVKAHTADDQRTKDVGDTGTDVDSKRHGDPQPGLGLQEGLQDLTPLVLVRSGSGLVGSYSLDSLESIFGGEESCIGDVRIEFKPDPDRSDNRQASGDNEDELPAVKILRLGVTKSVTSSLQNRCQLRFFFR